MISDRIERLESAEGILTDMLEAITEEIMDKESSLSLAIYEYASLGNEAFFIRINESAKKRWISLIEYGMETGEFKSVDPDRISDLILYYYQGLRMWSRVIPFEKQTAKHYGAAVRELLL